MFPACPEKFQELVADVLEVCNVAPLKASRKLHILLLSYLAVTYEL